MQSIGFLSQFGEAMFDCREDTNDQSAVQSCFVQDEYELIGLELKRGAIAIDIGAHIGGVTLLLALMGLEVYAYEPIRENHMLLYRNVMRNGMKERVHIFRQAVTDGEGIVPIYLGWKDKIHYYIGNLYSNTDESQSVETIGLDAVFAQNGIARCAVMKMDVEGSEFAILKNASKDTLGRIDFICGEYHTVQGPEAMTRKLLLTTTKELFDDVTEGPDIAGIGHFRFKRQLFL